jgi:hypothetical protein
MASMASRTQYCDRAALNNCHYISPATSLVRDEGQKEEHDTYTC